MLQDRWKSILDPLLSKPLSSANIVSNVSLTIGDNVINHKLGRLMQGWMLTDVTGAAVIYRSAPMNALTLTLNSDANVTVSLLVF
jgi:hypothetical protein